MGRIELNLSPGSYGLPSGKCSKHGGGVSAVRTEAPGKLTAVWTCQVCEAETKAAQKSGEIAQEGRQADRRNREHGRR
jgi:hypothetical protein